MKAFNILNFLNLEHKLKKPRKIPLPLAKTKSPISSNVLLFNQNKKEKNSNKMILQKNSNNKNVLLSNKKNLNLSKCTELIQSKKSNIEKKNMDKNNNKINYNNINIINNLENNAIEYFINSSNSIHKKRYSNSVHEQRKKVINNIYSKKHNKEKEINCLKLSSNNTNSTSINTNNTNNFNNKNNKIKITLSANLEEIKKENKKLKSKIETIGKENKILNKKVNKLRDKNLELRNILYSIKKEKDDYSHSINQSLKLLKLLKNNGLELSEIMENLSNSFSDKEEEENLCKNSNKSIDDRNNEIVSDNKNIHLYYFSENDKNQKNNDSSYSNVSFGRLECHEEFSLKKIPKELTHIPKLKIHNIIKENI